MITLKRNNLLSIIFILLAVSFQSCSLNTVFEEKIDFKNSVWKEDSIQSFSFEIKEDGNYDVFYIIKNKTDYPFSNLYLKTDLRDENQSISNKLQEVTLFDKKTGKPFGKGLGGVMESKFYALKSISLKSGKHNLTVQQYMRKEELTGIMAFGISVEKVND